MKFTKVYEGKYVSENHRFEISRYSGMWEVYDNNNEQAVYLAGKIHHYTRKYVGSANTLKEAKMLCK